MTASIPTIETLTTETEALSNPGRRQFIKNALFGGVGLMTSAVLPALAMADGMPKTTWDSPADKTAPKATKEASAAPLTADGKIAEMVFTERLKTVEGITPKQLDAHIGLYKGYVTKINQIEAEIVRMAGSDLSYANATWHPFRELQVERTYALNGVILHEYYFDNIGGPRKAPTAELKKEIVKAFGSWDTMVNELRATGMSMRGWAILAYGMRDRKLGIYGLDTHHHYMPANVVPLLVLDVYEHAYLIDFATDRKKYLEAFLTNVDWSMVEQRFNLAHGHGLAA